MTISAHPSNLPSVQRELITGSVVIAAIVMFIWTGGSALTAVVRYLTGVGPSVEQILLTALLLNIALILFGWRRYRDLEIEVLRRRDAEERARSLAETDPLTGFFNRRSIAEKGMALLDEARATQRSVAMLMLDLDNFKQVNDVHGHAAGDYVLATAATRIKALVPPATLTARLGGDEFACAFLFDPAKSSMVDRIAAGLVSAMAEPVKRGDLDLTVSTSVGIARSDNDCEDFDALMRHADIAMYCAKNQGRNRYVWFDASVERDLSMRSVLEASIRQGIPNGEFVPYYEPRVDLSDGALIGFEMQMRWMHPAQGLISPEAFISVAEQNSLIADLSLAVMRRAFQEAGDWDPSLTLSVHISATQLNDPWLSQKIRKLLVETGFPASRLEVEIRESTLFDNLSLGQAVVASFKNQGIRIALDDFGTGYASLAHLRALPFDRIKVNRGFTSLITQNDESASFVGTITALGESMGLQVTAEGVDDEALAVRLRELGCTEGQGRHFGKPMTIEQTRHMLAQRSLLLSRSNPDAVLDDDDMKAINPRAIHEDRKAG